MNHAHADTPDTITDHALTYIGLGWGLCSIPRGTKGPTDDGWNSPALIITTADRARAITQSRPDNGLGLVHAASGTCAIDVDHLDYFRLCMAELGVDVAELFAGAPRIIGKEGRDKAIFRMPVDVPAKMHKLTWPKPPGADKPVTIFELRAGPVQDVLPPTIHPDTHNPYRWRDGTEPWVLASIPELPLQLCHVWRAWDSFKLQFMAMCPWAEAPPAPRPRTRKEGPHSNVIGQFNEAHDIRAMLEAHGYKRVGKRYLAPTSESRLPGVTVFEDGTHCYSHHASDPLNDGHAHDAFSIFCLLAHGGDMGDAVRAAAEILGIDSQRPEPVSMVDISALVANAKKRKTAEPPVFVASETPSHLLRLPGALGDFVDVCNRSAPKPQPQFAVQAALAFGSVILGRRYRSENDNWPGMYFVNVGKSASGKEHARKVCERALAEAGLPQLIGPRGYTSDSGVFSALYHQPAHLAVIDEIGEMMRNSKAAGNFHKKSSITMLLEAWGLTSGTMRSQGYSTIGREKEKESHKVIERPSLTLLGMSTPRTFWDGLDESAIEGGLLNRLIVVESSIGRQLSRRADPLNIPESVVEWCKAVRAPRDGNLTGVDTGPEVIPCPHTVPMTDEAWRVFDAYEVELLERMEHLEREKLEELEGRSREKAMRIAMVLAVSDRADTPAVSGANAKWAVDYVRHYTAQTIDSARRHMHGSQFSQWRGAVLEVIERAGAKGRTERELAKYCRVYAGLEPRQRKAVLDSLRGEGSVEYADMGHGQAGRGRPRHAWVALAEVEEEL